MTIVHVLIPFTTKMACGKQGYANAIYRDHVTCKLCKKTPHYKALNRAPKSPIAKNLRVNKPKVIPDKKKSWKQYHARRKKLDFLDEDKEND